MAVAQVQHHREKKKPKSTHHRGKFCRINAPEIFILFKCNYLVQQNKKTDRKKAKVKKVRAWLFGWASCSFFTYFILFLMPPFYKIFFFATFFLPVRRGNNTAILAVQCNGMPRWVLGEAFFAAKLHLQWLKFNEPIAILYPVLAFGANTGYME